MPQQLSKENLNQFLLTDQHTALLCVLATHQDETIRTDNVFGSVPALNEALDCLPSGLFVAMRQQVDNFYQIIRSEPHQMAGEFDWLLQLIELDLPASFLGHFKRSIKRNFY